MVYFYLFITMLFLHLFADFTLQGWFAQGKQRSWWVDQCNKAGLDFRPYRYDYLCAMIGHSVYWSLVTFAPVLFMVNWPGIWVAVLFLVVQITVHAVIDDLKANKLRINLIQDQLAHILQIILAVLVFGVLGV